MIPIFRNENWVFEYDPETEHQNMEWNTSASSNPKKKTRTSKPKIKRKLIHFFDSRGIIQKEIVPKAK